MAHPKHEAVRQRFLHRCGYCGVSEEDSGGELTVDHYCPISAGGDDSDANLVYACPRCNQYKSDFWPDEREAAAGIRLLHPLQDDLAIHLRETEDCLLEGLTETGRVHIAMLHLNRPPLVVHRQHKKKAEAETTQNRLLRAVVAMQDRTMVKMARYIAYLHGKADISPEDEESR